MSWSPACDLIQCRFSEGALQSGLAGVIERWHSFSFLLWHGDCAGLSTVHEKGTVLTELLLLSLANWNKGNLNSSFLKCHSPGILNMNGCIDRSKILIFFGFFFNFYFAVLCQNVFIHYQGSLMKFHFFHLFPISSRCRFFFSAQSSWQDLKTMSFAQGTCHYAFWFCWVGGNDLFHLLQQFLGSLVELPLLAVVLLCCWVWHSSLVKLCRGLVEFFSCRFPTCLGDSIHTFLLPLLLSMPEHHIFCFLGTLWISLDYALFFSLRPLSVCPNVIH